MLSIRTPYFLKVLQRISASIQTASHQRGFRRAGQGTHTERCVFLSVPHGLLEMFKYFRAHEYRERGCARSPAGAFHNTTAPNALLVLSVVYYAGAEEVQTLEPPSSKGKNKQQFTFLDNYVLVGGGKKHSCTRLI